MARPREFDEEEVLEKAMDVFWAHGYEATSVADLMEATGLAKGSIYKGFGDKRSLFIRAMEHYLQNARSMLAEQAAGAVGARQALRTWLAGVVEMATGSGLRKGCLAVNCAVELAPHDADIRRRLKSHEKRVEQTYAALIRRGVEEGSLRENLDPDAAARWLTTVIDGLQVRGKLGLTRAEAEEAIEMALSALEKP
jgi:TetR/AcrR family transcriptional repressor of nem operon